MAGLCSGGLPSSPLEAGQPADVVIDPAAVALKAERLEFQFQAGIGSATDFELWRATELGETGTWSLADDGAVEAIAEGLFRGSLPVAGARQASVRVRRCLLYTSPSPRD